MSENIAKITIEWTNGDRRTFENAAGLEAAKIKQARRLLTESVDEPEGDKKNV